MPDIEHAGKDGMTAGKQRDVSWLPSQRTGSGLSLFLVDARRVPLVVDGLTA